ncbi:TPA: replication initiation protein [Burkholderia multivorans]|nr:replication initiation protein [Burkholderia multivorans]HEF4745948.1 replication initiation protein [Burkholderia multivorans]
MPRKPASKGSDKQVSLFQTPEPPDLLRKAVQAIHIAPKSGKIGLQQRKMFSSLIKNALRQEAFEPGRTSFSISIAALSHESGLNSNNTKYVKDTVNSLISTVVNWDYLAADRSTVWKASGLLAGAELEQSVLKYSFSDQIRSELLNPEIYALIDMRIAREFRRSHSLALWENTVRYEGIGITAKIPLPKFRDLILGQDKASQSYKEYKLFKSKVLVPCIQEVNEVSDHTLELIEHKSGRSVEAVQFKVTRKPSADTVEEGDVKNEALVDEVAKFGIPRSEARRLITQYGVQRIKGAIAYTLNRTTKKNAAPIDNVAAYFRKALTHGYTLSDGQGAETGAAVQESAQSKQEQIRDKYLAAKVEEAGAYFRELEIDDQTKLIERYNETVAGSKDLTLSPKKKASKLAQTSFFRWLALDTWGEPTSDDLLEFLLKSSLAAN